MKIRRDRTIRFLRIILTIAYGVSFFAAIVYLFIRSYQSVNPALTVIALWGSLSFAVAVWRQLPVRLRQKYHHRHQWQYGTFISGTHIARRCEVCKVTQHHSLIKDYWYAAGTFISDYDWERKY